MDALSVMKRALPPLLSVAIGLGSFAGRALYGRGTVAEIEAGKAQIQALQDDLAAARAAKDAEVSTVTSEATGADHKRERKELSEFKKFVDECATYDSYESYCAARDKAKDVWGLPEDGSFLSSYMAYIGETVSVDGSVTYNIIDAEGLNQSLDGVEDYLVEIDGDTYRHFSFVSFRTYSKSAKRSDTYDCVASWGMTSSGELVDVVFERI